VVFSTVGPLSRSLGPLFPTLYVEVLEAFKDELHLTRYHKMSADQSQQQLTGHDNNTQAAVLVPATILLTVSLLLYGIHLRGRRSSPLVWTDGMVTAALVSGYEVLLAPGTIYPDSNRYWPSWTLSSPLSVVITDWVDTQYTWTQPE